MFAVVEFLNSEMEPTGEISIVPLIWLIKNKTKCYWPIRTNKVPFTKFVEDLTPFKKSWPTYKVNTRFTCGKIFLKHVKFCLHPICFQQLMN